MASERPAWPGSTARPVPRDIHLTYRDVYPEVRALPTVRSCAVTGSVRARARSRAEAGYHRELRWPHAHLAERRMPHRVRWCASRRCGSRPRAAPRPEARSLNPPRRAASPRGPFWGARPRAIVLPAMDLSTLRDRIDEVDRKIIALIAERLRIV